ncbi:MAG: Mur ligase family protein [Simkaniaceae bacterium]|nr:Mur ligase family protein [Simkaniaceae bacterium]
MRVKVLGRGVSGMAAIRYLQRHGHEIVEEGQELVVISPGIKPQGGEIAEVELALRDVRQPCIGITGTNGKTTTVLMVEHVLNRCGKRAIACGNIGLPVCDVVGGNEILVIELSSFQLETMHSKVFDVGAVLNVTPDHLDRHGTMEAYRAAKYRLKDLVHGEFFDGLGTNESFARAICAHFGVNDESFSEALLDFKRPEHRLEFVKEVDGISYYNDSKGTNVASTIFATEQIEKPIVLLVGGKDKGLDFSHWSKLNVKEVIAFGEAAEKICGFVEAKLARNLEEAFHLGRKQAISGDAVLLSPGCASFDEFKNYEERGKKFKSLCEELV